jgi:hypothetical protein
MYQPYPGEARVPEAQPAPAPACVRKAVKLMYAGAVASLIGIVVDVSTLNATKSAMNNRFPNLTPDQVTAQELPLIVGWIVGGLVGIALWIIIAQASLRGRNWARITGTVLFGIATVEAFGSLLVPEAALVKVFWFVVWLIGVAAVVYLWQRSSSAFFTGTRP